MPEDQYGQLFRSRGGSVMFMVINSETVLWLTKNIDLLDSLGCYIESLRDRSRWLPVGDEDDLDYPPVGY